MRSRVFAVFGMLCLVCGGVVLAGSTFGFATVATDRGVTADTAQESAYIGIEPVGESISGRQDTATVARLTNNLDASMSLQTTVSQGGALAIQNGFDSSVAAGDSTSLTLACAGGGSGTQAVTVVVDQATADGVTVEGATITVDVDYQCTGSSKGQLSVQSVSQTGIGTVAVEVENTGSKQAKIKSASIDATTSAATRVSNGNGPEVSIDGAEVVNVRGNQQMTIDGAEYGKGSPVTIQPGSTATVAIGQFQSGNGQAVDMEGETVEFTLYGNGQSSYSLSGNIPVSVTESGSVDTEGSVVVEYDGNVDGDVDAGGDVTTNSESEIGGGVDAGGDVTSGYNSGIDGDVSAGGDVTTGSESELGGDVSAGGDVMAGYNSEIDGSVDAGGDVSTGTQVEIGGDVDSTGDVTVGYDSTVDGDIQSGGDVTINGSTEIGGSIDADGDVTIEYGAAVDGDITAGGDITIGGDSEIGGDVDAGGNVTINYGAEVDGSVSADGTVTDRR